jgi:uncharacterized protein YegJ (DUF2314 family)
MKTVFALLFAAALATTARAQSESTHMAGRDIKTPGHPGYLMVPDDDKAMDRAVEHAQKSLGFFIAALKKKMDGDSDFEIKKGFVDGDQVEHLWISDLTFDGQNFRGRINNRPLDVKNIKLGQQVTVAPRDVSDWMFVKDGKLMGGYTTRVLYRRLSPQDKAEFDNKAEFKIE